MNHPIYGRGFSTPRERIVESITWALCGASLMALFITGVIYVWPKPKHAPVLRAEPATHAELAP